MKKFWDLIIGFIFAVCFVIIGYPMGSEFWDKWYYWFGTAFGLGLSFCIGTWNKQEIDELKKEIDELKKNVNR